MPQSDAGCRNEPPMSLPIPSTACPAATAAADPPLDPPGTLVGSHGLRVGPNPEFSVDALTVKTKTLVLPSTTTPAGLSRATTLANSPASSPTVRPDNGTVVMAPPR